MFKNLKDAFKTKDIRNKMLMTLLILLIYRIGCFIPTPGLNPSLINLGDQGAKEFLNILSTITGGSLSQGTLFSLGIVPYINASIIMQLLTLIIKPLEELSKKGEEGRQKITQITKYVTILLAIVQAIGIVISWNNSGYVKVMFGSESKVAEVFTIIFVILYFTAGSCIVMWLSDRITEYGIGNGTSLIIFVGILSGFFTGLLSEFDIIANDVTNIWRLLLYLLVVLIVFLFIVFIDMSERRIEVIYGNKQRGNRSYMVNNSVIPIKINAGGVMPIIFASSFLMFPQLIGSMINSGNNGFYIWWTANLGVGTWGYGAIMALLILGFSFFYAKIQFDPYDISKRIQENDGVIRGISPGKKTAEFLNGVNNRITFFGAIFLAILSLVPSLVFSAILTTTSSLVNAFSATGMLIVVSVALEFNRTLEAQLAMKNLGSRKNLL